MLELQRRFNKKEEFLIELIIISSVVILDQISKYLAVKFLMNGSIAVIEGVFHFTYATNTGAAFSLFSNSTFVLGIISAIAVIIFSYILFKYIKDEKSYLTRISLSFIIGGAIGNMIDRFFLSYVVDFLDFRLINFAIFNIADSFITIGAIGYLISVLFVEKDFKEEL